MIDKFTDLYTVILSVIWKCWLFNDTIMLFSLFSQCWML